MGAEPRPRRAWPWQLLTGVLAVATGVLLTGRIDLRPPTLVVEPGVLPARSPAGQSVSGQVHDDRPGLALLEVQVDNGEWTELPVDAAGRFTWTGVWEHGPHALRLRATDASWLSNAVEWEGGTVVDAQGPAARLSWAEPVLRAGAAAWVAVRADADAAEVSLELGGVRWPLLRETTEGAAGAAGESLWTALVALPLDHPEGDTTWILQLADDLANSAEQQGTVAGEARRWPRGGTIPLTAEQQAARDDTAGLEAMRAARAAAVGQTRPGPPLERVQQPCQGWVSSPFGRYRTYSDGERQHHLGMDIANILGTPVGAMAAGRVTLAAEQPIHGRTVIVDHGRGVSSSYSHLSAIEVELGDELAPGQTLGRVGSTGQSTGPHLHWELTVGGIPVDPVPWLATVPQPLDAHTASGPEPAAGG